MGYRKEAIVDFSSLTAVMTAIDTKTGSTEAALQNGL